MSKLLQKLTDAQTHAMSKRPKVGGFPFMAEVFRQAGLVSNRWSLPACQSVYIFDDGSVVQQGEPLFAGMREVPKFNQEALIKALRTDQEGKSTFPEFLMAAWSAGVVGYEVDFGARKVTYFGVAGENYCEDYPAVEVNI